MDLKKAYDSIHRESLVNILKEFRFPSKIVNLIGAGISQTDIKVKIAKHKITARGSENRSPTRQCTISSAVKFGTGKNSTKNEFCKELS